MVKFFLTAALQFCYVSIFSQTSLPDNFAIGNILEIYANDSARVYFSCNGMIGDKRCADFYRVGKLDSVILNFTGEFFDFYPSGKLLFKATMVNNSIEGYGAYYHENGNMREEGNFKNNLRTGTWKYYYPEGSLEKVYDWKDEEPLILEAYKKDGTATVTNGKGDIETDFRYYNKCEGFKASGSVLNGKKDGKWKFENFFRPGIIATETYRQGVFVSGSFSNGNYTKDPKIKLSKYYPNEAINLIENGFGCPGDKAVSLLKYNNEFLTSAFYPTLQEEASKGEDQLRNQWLLIGITIDKENTLKLVSVRSSINDAALEQKIYSIVSKMKKWKAISMDSGPVESNICFTILVDNKQLIVLPDYIHKNR